VNDAPLLLYDGGCALCNRTVLFVLRHERRHSLRFAPLGGRSARGVAERHPEIAGLDAVVWVENPGEPDERALTASDAVLALARYMGGPWRALAVARIVPTSWRDVLYDFVARRRHRLGGVRTRDLPDAVGSERFLD
jgi:predicted DCC family thiol-disulfide oxidoreductase YuxK